MASYVKFYTAEKPPTRVTERVEVLDLNGKSLGTIKYYPWWRKYCFFPNAYTLYDDGCLREIENKIIELNLERKERLKEEHNENN